MDRRQLFFIVLLNSIISLVLAVTVVWIADARRPDPEELVVRFTPEPTVVLIATSTPESNGESSSETVETTPTSAPVTSTPVPTSEEQQIYVVEDGDTLFGLAVQFGLTVDELMEANELPDPNFVFTGQRLVIPQPGGNPSGNSSPSTSPQVVQEGLQIQVEQPGNMDQESVLIVNDGNSAVNLQGWTLGNANGPAYDFGDLPLFPGGSVRLHTRSGEDDSLNRFWGQTEPVWQSGSVARLFNQNGDEVADYTVP